MRVLIPHRVNQFSVHLLFVVFLAIFLVEDIAKILEIELAQELFHGHLVPIYVCKKLLSMRSGLCRGSSSYMLFDFFPVFAEHLKSLKKSDVLFTCPTTVLCLVFCFFVAFNPRNVLALALLFLL
jgi:hypothetical protein